ncbi:hypothetical protein GCM10009557_09890 [Virgisporangium ochraceum]|uniref:Uncharacterized protein n=1 Tax=Virgisporangium ochraceum TaxID=65505 RepID=A0A8J4EE27_9ACTN|nr:hypothetical protein [Virgisporangium ochraceum]GIJ71304.1 hypothetical protein Voc01_062210 [Virgisporangium ochraceum]
MIQPFLDAVLDVILDRQDDLDADSWNGFIDRLLATGVGMFAVDDYFGAEPRQLQPLG